MLTWRSELFYDARLADQRLQVVQHTQNIPHLIGLPQLVQLQAHEKYKVGVRSPGPV